MKTTTQLDCLDFYLWSIGKLNLDLEPEYEELLLTKEDK